MSERFELPPVLLAVVLATCSAACGGDDGASGPNALSLSNRLDGAPSAASDEDAINQVLGASERYACGVGKPAAAGEKFDSYEPASCSDLEIRFGDLDDFEFPNWT